MSERLCTVPSGERQRGEFMVEVRFVERHADHAATLVQPVQFLKVGGDEDDQVVRGPVPRSNVFGLPERQLDQGVPSLCGLEARSEVGTGDDSELGGWIYLMVSHGGEATGRRGRGQAAAWCGAWLGAGPGAG